MKKNIVAMAVSFMMFSGVALAQEAPEEALLKNVNTPLEMSALTNDNAEAALDDSKRLDEASGFYAAKDYDKAYDIFRDLANNDNVIAMISLAIMYEHGEGVAPSLKEAFFWYKKAAELGYAPAQVRLGMMYFDGVGVAKNPDLALKWLVSAAENGEVMASNLLGMIALSQKDAGGAQKWFNLAANSGDPVALCLLGKFAESGWSTAKDDVLAKKYYSEAEKSGKINCKNIISELKIE